MVELQFQYGRLECVEAAVHSDHGVVVTGLLSVIPALYQQKRLSELSQLIRLAGTISGMLGTVLFLPLLVWPEQSLELIFGEGYAAAATPLLILTVGNLFNLWTGSCGITLMMTGHESAHLGQIAAWRRAMGLESATGV